MADEHGKSEDMTQAPAVGLPIRYVPQLHFEQVHRWYAARNETMTPDALPQIGFIIPGKAAGFLYRTDSSLAWIEGLVAAPELSREERAPAIDAVVVAVCDEARRLGFKVVMGYTQLDAVVSRAQRLGFTYVGGNYHLVALPL